ncbi:MAG TPA: hypothetical protein VFZ76_13230 [Anaerolineales bacterium]
MTKKSIDHSGDALQEPNRPVGSLDNGYRLLLAALDVGWRVKEPVYLLPRWSEAGPWVYHFILQRLPNGQEHIVTIPLSSAGLVQGDPFAR